jgi:hypothetical protein
LNDQPYEAEVFDEYVEVLRLFLKEDDAFEPVSRGLEQRDRATGGNVYAALMAAALHVAARRRFGSSYTNPDVIRFVAMVRGTLQQPDADIDPRTAEAVLRTVLGSSAADMGGDVYAQAKALPAMLLVMVRLLDLPDSELSAFLAEARALAASTLADAGRTAGPGFYRP